MKETKIDTQDNKDVFREIAAADAEESSESSEEETSAWEIVQDDAVQTADSDGVTSLLDHFGSMYYSSCVEYYATDLAAYGLEEPAYTIRIWTISGSDDTQSGDIVFYIGNMDENGEYYIREEGSNQVHTIGASSLEEVLSARAEDFLAG